MAYEINIWIYIQIKDFRTGAIVNSAIPLNLLETNWWMDTL